jgi:hypothetical protein
MTGEPEERDDDWIPGEAVEAPPPKPWGSRAQVLAAVLWSSFLAACLATMLFFAWVDPGMIHEGSAPELEATRMTAYGIGFFFFWFVAIVASAVSVYLIRTSHLGGREGDGPP